MKFLQMILKNIKNLTPYLSLIAVYFFFVNIEARKDNSNKEKIEFSKDETSNIDQHIRVKIPVIQYKN